jgi:hypothetical protein
MPFPQRDAILFLTFCVIFVTLVLQGLTLLIRRLGVVDQPFEKCEEVQARRIMIDTALSKLEESTDREKPEMKDDEVESHYRLRLQALERGERENRLDPRKQDQFEQLGSISGMRNVRLPSNSVTRIESATKYSERCCASWTCSMRVTTSGSPTRRGTRSRDVLIT